MEKKCCHCPYFTYTVKRGERTFPKTQSGTIAQLRFFVLVTDGTFTSHKTNHPRRGCYGMLDMLGVWGFLVLFGTLVLKGKTQGRQGYFRENL